MAAIFSSLSGWEATKETLHAYSRVVGMVPRTFGTPHPKWWHISLRVSPFGLVTGSIPLPGGGNFNLRLDFNRHEVVLSTHQGERGSWSMQAGDTASQLAEKIFPAVAGLGLEGEYLKEKFEDEEPRVYDAGHAVIYWNTVVNIHQAFKKHWNSIPGEVGPIQVWPHGFDLAFEWFGTRKVEIEEHGEIKAYPSQLNLGWSPGESSHPAPYFYSNPWPFEGEQLTGHALPHGARWFVESWQGSILEYEDLAGDPDAEQKLLEYARAVFDLVSPTLTG